jgi:uncharacterized protein with ATP-grasp and redox domains
MITNLECLPCLTRQAIDTVQRIGMPISDQQTIVKNVLQLLSTVDTTQPAPVISRMIHQLIREQIKIDDPFRDIKAESNMIAEKLIPHVEVIMHWSDNPIAVAIRAAIAGNIIDYGVKRNIDLNDIQETLNKALKMSLDANMLKSFQEEAMDAKSILYLADNAGEIMFDRLLIELLPYEKVTLAVRGGPVLNDATYIDALYAGLDKICEVIDNGSDIPGTAIEYCSPDFQKRFWAADMIISKGQGNFETLIGIKRPVYYLFIAKCPLVAQRAGCSVNTPVFSTFYKNSRSGEVNVSNI